MIGKVWRFLVSFYRQAVGAENPISSRWSEWVWPMYAMRGTLPVISDGYGKDKRGGKGHFGVDMMRRRKEKDKELPFEYKGTSGTAPWYYVYDNDMALSAGPGQVHDVRKESTGLTVRVNHRVSGKPILAVYRHLRTVQPHVKAGAYLSTGESIGLIGDNPADSGDPPHLHFELWDTSKASKYPDWTIDPASVMRSWQVVHLDGGIVGPYDGSKPGGGSSGGSGVSGLLALMAVAGVGVPLLLKAGKGGRYV